MDSGPEITMTVTEYALISFLLTRTVATCHGSCIGRTSVLRRYHLRTFRRHKSALNVLFVRKLPGATLCTIFFLFCQL